MAGDSGWTGPRRPGRRAPSPSGDQPAPRRLGSRRTVCTALGVIGAQRNTTESVVKCRAGDIWWKIGCRV